MATDETNNDKEMVTVTALLAANMVNVIVANKTMVMLH